MLLWIPVLAGMTGGVEMTGGGGAGGFLFRHSRASGSPERSAQALLIGSGFPLARE
jgi:hypothetical protein